MRLVNSMVENSKKADEAVYCLPICFTLGHTHIPFHNLPKMLSRYEWFTLRNFVRALVCDFCVNAVNEGRGG